MARKQKIGKEESGTRSLLLDAAEHIMREEGYPAVTSRRVGAKAQVSSKLVHYYFPTMDDLFLALYRRTSDRFLGETDLLLQSEDPIRVLWQTSVGAGDVGLFMELMAIGRHHDVLRVEMQRGLNKLRTIQIRAIERHFTRLGVTPSIAPAALLILLVGSGLLISLEARGETSIGHAETIALFEQLSVAQGKGGIFQALDEIAGEKSIDAT